jgi:diketogulonate reductase-like aldo/keto reductase
LKSRFDPWSVEGFIRFLFASIEYPSVSARLFKSADIHKHGIVLAFTLISPVSVTCQNVPGYGEVSQTDKLRGIRVTNYSVLYLKELLGQISVVPKVNQIENHHFLPRREIVKFCKWK